MKLKVLLTTILLYFIFTANAQNLKQKDKIINLIKAKAISEISTKCIDIDLDYIFSYRVGESMYFEVYQYKNGTLVQTISEPGNISFDYNDAIVHKPSSFVLKSYHYQCCGESPFPSFRKFTFHDDTSNLVENYVFYDYENYCNDERIWDYLFFPDKTLPKPYTAKIIVDNYNVRFSADLQKHNAEFVCVENTNIIGYLKKNATVTVLAEEERADSNLRTWFYVEIKKEDLNCKTCGSPLSFDYFKGQKLRAWISDKYIVKQKKTQWQTNKINK